MNPKRLLQLLIFGVLALSAIAQVAVNPPAIPHVTFVNGDGGPCASCQLFTYAAGTTTPLATYTDASGTSQNTNPIVLDAAGGANIWLGNNSYKLILKASSGATIWSVDQIKGGSGTGDLCGPAGGIQIANTAGTGLTCDTQITINSTTHTINIGTLPANHVTIGPSGTPTTWMFDTTSPATALASLNAVADGAGVTTANQLALSTTTAHGIAYSAVIPSGVTAITKSPGDNSTNPATTAYVALPGAIAPTSVQVASGSVMTDNQGNGAKIQHSTGSPVSGDCAQFDANGNVVDAGATCVAAFTGTSGYQTLPSGLTLQWATGSGCGGDCTQTITFPVPFAHACFVVFTTNYNLGSTNIVKDWGVNAPCTTTQVVVQLQRRGDEGSFVATPQIMAIGW